jgi:hypothetical protein
MGNITYIIGKKTMLLGLLMLPFLGIAQHFTVSLANMTTTSDTFEVDVTLTIDGTTGVRLTSCSTGINFNPAILNGGTPCSPNNCGSWSLVPGTIAPELTANGGLNLMNTTTRYPYGHLRIVQLTKVTSQVDLLPGTYRIGRFRFTNTAPWTANSDADLWLSPTNSSPTPGSSNTIVGFAPYGSSNMIRNATTTTSPHYVTVGYTQGNPLRGSVLNSAQLATIDNEAVTDIVKAYPNPFENTFKFYMNGASSEAIQVEVYDILGKRIEDFTVETSRMNGLEIGQSYPSGFYNLKVSQGDKTQSIKMIKQ